MTFSRSLVDSSVWPPGFLANPAFGSPITRAQKTAKINNRDFIKINLQEKLATKMHK
jgi:hypothetical protein